MPENLPARAISLALKEPGPVEVEAGTVFSFAVIVTPSGCDLGGAPFNVMESDEVLITGELPALSGDNHDIVEIMVTAPEQIGHFEWTLVVPAYESSGILYEEGSLAFSITTRPHATSLAVWDNPSPVVIGKQFRVKVGAKCTAACSLTGKEIEIQDETGAIVCSGALGERPWDGTTALYWTSVEMAAPTCEGHFTWQLKFSAAELRLPHSGASCAFSFVTVRPPEHSVSVKVVDKHTEAPIPDAQVRLSVYRTSTDEKGLARFAVPAGEHRLFIWKPGYDVAARTVAVSQTEYVRVEAAALPPEDPDAYWKG
jgi:hypothetical protein